MKKSQKMLSAVVCIRLKTSVT